MTPSATHKHLFYMEMAKLLEAGFDIRKAAGVLMDTRLPAAQEALLRDLNRGLEAGGTIAGALGADPGRVSRLELAILSAGERGGKLAAAFGHLAGYFGMLAATRRAMVRGVIYPLIVLHAGIVVATVPGPLMRGEPIGRILGGLAVALIVAYAVAVVAAVVIRAVFRAAPAHPGIDRLLNRVPWLGAARRHLAMARFSKVCHFCLLAGIPMWETMKISCEASHSGCILEAGKRLAAAAVDGQSLGPVLIAEKAFPTAFARSYATGEEAGTLDRDLERWAKWFQDEAGAASRTAAAMLPKVLYFLILAFAAWQFVGFFNSYYTDTLRQFDE